MAAPILIGIGIGVGSSLIEGAIHPMRSFIGAQFAPWDQVFKYKAWHDRPILIPEPGMLYQLYVREMIREDVLDWGLRYHGINPGTYNVGKYSGRRIAMWEGVKALHRTVPGPEVWAQFEARGWLEGEDATRHLVRSGGNLDYWREAVKLSLARPSPDFLWDSYIRGLLTYDEAIDRVRRAGGDTVDFESAIPLYSEFPGIAELGAAANRGIITEEVWREWLRRNRVTDDNVAFFHKEMRKGIPGVGDLNMFGIRHSWQPELVERYGYYLEFPERLREWYRKLGLDYGVGFQAVTDTGAREVTLADAYWASHWHVLPLNSAFQAYQRFQPDLVHRFQVDNPNLQPFTRDDLNIHMRQADFPPGVREWLTALAHPVLGTRVIQQGAQYLQWDRAEIQSRYRLLGYTTDDAAVLARLAEARQTAREQAWMKTIETRAHQQTVHMIEGLYTDGTIDRDFALRQLADAGLSAGLSVQLLDLQDFGVERSLVRASVSATSRDYLSGVLSRAEAETQLRRIGITDYRIGNYLAAWGIQRSARRKRLETAKVAGMVTAGLLGADEARARLANLQWSDPDATLLLAEAEGKLAKRLAAEQKSAETNARARAKELERLAKDADAQSRKLRAEANRIAPRSTLTKWVVDGIIDDDTFRSMMRDRGYDDTDIERYLRDAKQPKPRPPRPSPTTPPWPKPAGSAHPAQARLAKWLKDGIITIGDYADGLTDLGYSESDVERFVRDATGASNGQATGAPGGQAPPAP